MNKYRYNRKFLIDRFQSFYYGNKKEDEFINDFLALSDKGGSKSGVAPAPDVRPDYFGKCKTCNETLKPKNERDCEKCKKWTGSFTPSPDRQIEKIGKLRVTCLFPVSGKVLNEQQNLILQNISENIYPSMLLNQFIQLKKSNENNPTKKTR